MSEAKPFASLSSALLARKGHAKPAMRPQAFHLSPVPEQEVHSPELDDLGWNDMGQDDHADWPVAEPVALHGEPVVVPEEPPFVVAQHEQLAREFEPEVPFVSQSNFAYVPRSLPGTKAKAAFTLRLDTQRHLHLRMLSAVSHRSAQHIVTKALDDYLAAHPIPKDISRETETRGYTPGETQ
jgi:hypothetical protein